MSKLHNYKGVDYEPKNVNGELIELTDAECEVLLQQTNAWNDASKDRKLKQIKRERSQKLQETDFYALSDVTMSDAMTTYRQALRDIPQDYTTEDEYDLLLARDEQGQLTHSIWSKP